MERRRLRLHGAGPVTPVGLVPAAPELRSRLPGASLSVADTEQGNAATLWALDLLEGLAAAGARVPVVFCAYQQEPELAPSWLTRLAQASSSLTSLAVGTGPDSPAELLAALPAELTLAAPCWLLVGLPALVSFDARASILVTGELGVERWPEPLRGLRSRLTLEVPTPRPGLGRALARALLATRPD
jgi:hypothetical protein